VGNGHPVTLTPTEVHADDTGGAALNLVAGFTMPATNGRVGYGILITLGGTGVETAYTVTGTRDGAPVIESKTILAGGGTLEFVGDGYGWDTITSIESDVDPVATSEFDTLDTFFPAGMRGAWVGGAGNLTIRLLDDAGDTVYAGFAAGTALAAEFNRMRCNLAGRTGITETTATLITVAR
jgi:hypothetical protein